MQMGIEIGEVLIARTYRARRNRDGLVRRLYTADEIDAFAIYCMEIDRCFFIPMTTRQAGRRSGYDSHPRRTTSAARFNGLTTSISKLHCDRTKGP